MAESRGFAGISTSQRRFRPARTRQPLSAEPTSAALRRISEHVDLVFGFTALKLEDEQDAGIYLWVPRRTINLALTGELPALPQVELGLNGKWQSDIPTIDGYTNGEVRQDSYALLGAFVRWDATEHTTVRFNANNLTDEKYITSLYQVGFYGAPANYSLTFGYDF